ncbi:MAG: hypothetical protein GXY83_18015 [Rhodopirellula sp.]|nr:hypothetical protein [Rhodopirellula sp.]
MLCQPPIPAAILLASCFHPHNYFRPHRVQVNVARQIHRVRLVFDENRFDFVSVRGEEPRV